MSHADPYSDFPAGSAPPQAEIHDGGRGRSRSRSPVRNGGGSYRSPAPRSPRRRSPPPRKPNHAPAVGSSPNKPSRSMTKAAPARAQNPTPTSVLGVFGLSIRTQERDLEDEFGRFGRVEKVTIVYDQRTDRSRGFGFIVMGSVEDATRCVQELNGVDLNGRRIRVDYSVTDRPHAPTPGEYMGLRRSNYNERRGEGRDSRRDDRDRYDRDRHHDRYDRRDDRDRDHYRESRDYRDRDRRTPPRSSTRYSPRRRSHSRSPPRGSGGAGGGTRSPGRMGDYENVGADAPRW